MDAQTQFQAQDLISALQHLQLLTYLDVASAALYLFDYLVTLSQEVELVWKSKWTIMKALYLLTRYLPFIDVFVALWHQATPHMSLDDCLIFYKICAWMLTIGMSIAELIFTLRTWVVLDQHHYLTVAMPILYIAIAVPALVIVNIFVNSLQFIILPLPDFKGCFVSDAENIMWCNFTLLAIYEGLMLLLMAFRAYQQFREVAVGSSQLLNIILKDGIIYYLYLFAISVINVILIRILPRDLVGLLALFARNIHAILACRVLMNIRGQLQGQVIIGSRATIGDLATVSAFQVASRSFASNTDEED